MSDIKWEDPPPRSRSDWESIAAALRDRPGTWALVAENASPSMGALVRRGRVRGFSEGDFEAVNRGIKGGQGRVQVFARFVGASSAEEES